MSWCCVICPRCTVGLYRLQLAVWQGFFGRGSLGAPVFSDLGIRMASCSQLPRALLRNRGYAFGLWLSLSGHNFGPFAWLRHFQGLVWLLKDRFRNKKNRLYMLADCSNHVKAVETALFRIVRPQFWAVCVIKALSRLR